MLPLGGKEVLWHILERTSRCTMVDQVVVSTSTSPSDSVIVDAAKTWGFDVFQGEESDLLGRLCTAARATNAQFVLRVPADKPLFDPDEADRVIRAHLTSRSDYSTNMPADWPECMEIPFGLEVEVVSADALYRSSRDATDEAEREHGLTHLYHDASDYSILRIPTSPRLRRAGIRLALDEPADYELLRTVYDSLWKGPGTIIPTVDALDFLDRQPTISSINTDVCQRPGLLPVEDE